jgi:DnaJ homolog subfamily C member 7
MSGRNSMDVDREPVNGASPASPSTNTTSRANTFTVPIPDGTTHEEPAPTPPPHKANPTEPPTTPLDDAESYKAAGNRHFKAKDYAKAIEQYSKGLSSKPLAALLIYSC